MIKIEKCPHGTVNDVAEWNKIDYILSHIGSELLTDQELMKKCAFKLVEKEHDFNVNYRYARRSVQNRLYFDENSSEVFHIPIVLQLENEFANKIIWAKFSEK